MKKADLKNGYTRIANPLLDALIRARLPVYERSVVDAIIRETFGWQQSKRQVSIGRIVQLTGISKSRIYQKIRRLIRKQIIFKQETKSTYSPNIFGLNKRYQEWKVPGSTSTGTSASTGTISSASTGTIGSASTGTILPPTQRKVKETLNKLNNILCNKTFKTFHKWKTRVQGGREQTNIDIQVFRKYGEERIKKALAKVDRAYKPSLSTFWDALLGKKR